MKKILIVNKSFETGGIQSSMINMANTLSEYYQVDLFIFNPTGVLLERLDKEIKIIKPSWRIECLGMSLKQAFSTKSVKRIAFKIFSILWSKIFDNRLPVNMAIKHQRKIGDYDLAISYHQEQRKNASVSGFSRVVDKCVNADKKIAWMHFDCNTVNLDSAFNNQFYEKMDKLVFVSKSLMQNFNQQYPTFKDKTDYCYNFMLYDVIKEKSLAEQQIEFPENKFICFSACRLTAVKAIPRAINALKEVFKKYIDVVWYIAGDGGEREAINNLINAYGLQDQIILIGNQNNPYPYIKNSDLLINVSFNEAAPVTFFESKAIGTPVFATETVSARELLNQDVDSFICPNSEEGICAGFERLLLNKHLVFNAKEVLKNYDFNNDDSLEKIKEFVG